MTSVVVPPASVGAPRAAVLGATLLLTACGGPETPAPIGSGGGTQAGAGMSAGGAGGSAGGSGGAPSATGGVGGAGASGAAAGADGGAGTTGSGGTNAGAAGMASGGAGVAGSPPMGGGGAGGASPTGGAGGSRALSFRADIYPVFQMTRNPAFVYPGAGSFESCNDTGVCHGGDSAPGAGLRMMDADMAYGMLLGVMSQSDLCNGTIRVAAGNPEQSCLVLFYEGRLRDELDWVDTAEIDLMRQWIAQGALP